MATAAGRPARVLPGRSRPIQLSRQRTAMSQPSRYVLFFLAAPSRGVPTRSSLSRLQRNASISRTWKGRRVLRNTPRGDQEKREGEKSEKQNCTRPLEIFPLLTTHAVAFVDDREDSRVTRLFLRPSSPVPFPSLIKGQRLATEGDITMAKERHSDRIGHARPLEFAFGADTHASYADLVGTRTFQKHIVRTQATQTLRAPF